MAPLQCYSDISKTDLQTTIYRFKDGILGGFRNFYNFRLYNRANRNYNALRKCPGRDSWSKYKEE